MAARQRVHSSARFFVHALLLFSLLNSGSSFAFGFQNVVLRAKTLAGRSFQNPASNIPEALQRLDRRHYEEIRYRPEKALWRAATTPFKVEFFHQGNNYNLPVKIFEVTEASTRELAYAPSLFTYGSNQFDQESLRHLGFPGLRILYPVNHRQREDEVVSFLGASYFRALGKHQRYGLSARGLAIDTALGSGEEFPRFVAFWLVRPTPRAKEMTIYGLLDSPRATGAYRFVLQPGVTTEMDVTARIFLRGDVGKLGLAPLTSMYLFGDTRPPNRNGDFRPSVHDSDGLSIQTGTGEWIWRPLTNPKRLLVTSFATTDPLGFGLMQRRRDFAAFEDIADRYDLRPSAWVEPKGKWGRGRVELVQIPVPDETNDNIVAYWVPERAPKAGETIDIAYRLRWQMAQEMRPPGWTARTLLGRAYPHAPDGSHSFAVDFAGPALAALPPDTRPEATVTVDANAQLIENQLMRNDAIGGWRLILRVRRGDPAKPVELRAGLRHENKPLTETWSHILPPD